MLEDEFGDIIGKARVGQGLAPDRVAREAGIESGLLQRLEDCRQGPSDEQASRLAAVLGLDAGKLQAVARGRYVPRAPAAEVLRRVQEVTGYIGNYPVHGYLLGCALTGLAAAVDTAYDPAGMLRAAEERGWRIDTVLVTHTHEDHVGGLAELRAGSGARVVVQREERAALAGLWDEQRDMAFADGEELRVGEMTVRCLHTPGHTPGSAAYVADGVVFVGDTLFAGSTGRANFRFDALLRGVRERILVLPETTAIFPGHGPPSTVGEERSSNPFF